MHSVVAPQLIVVVDTEEEFDWGTPFSRSATGVSHIKHQDRTQRILEHFGVQPVYVVDFPVASQEAGFRPLREWRRDGRCLIGAHLHPWVNPPYDEELSIRNSYPGNLPAALERAKLARLTDEITAHFEERPIIYRAGRYGVGAATAAILEDLGYLVDTSVVPRTDFRADGGPDFSAFGVEPFWIGPGRSVLEVPLTVGWYGSLRAHGAALQPTLTSALGLRCHLPGIFARLGLLERIRLTPEGNSFAEMRRLTDALLAAGQRLFVLSYHSPTVVAGHTPYTRNEAELANFLATLERYCDYFFGACSGRATTLLEVRAALATSPAPASGGGVRVVGFNEVSAE